MRLALALMLAAGLAACKSEGRAGTVRPQQRSMFDDLPYRNGPLPDAAKVLLVAGGDDIANFGAEVVEQRHLWRKAGLRDDEIACYYAKPTTDALAKDAAQYRRLRRRIGDCFRADPARLQADLIALAERRPPYLYLYITAHGIDSLLNMIDRSRSGRAYIANLKAAERALLHQHAIGLNAGPSPKLEQPRRVIAAHRGGKPTGPLVLTPRTLHDALASFAPEIPKVIVLQACYSGGFIGHLPRDNPNAVQESTDLTAIPNLTAITATASDRPSFGCGSGRDKTYFGGAFNRALARYLDSGVSPPDLPWRAIYDYTAFAVDAMESVDRETPSEPGFFANGGT